jgi:hypothetical protein
MGEYRQCEGGKPPLRRDINPEKLTPARLTGRGPVLETVPAASNFRNTERP